jgi:4'-phosphopantetheinyl transferase
MQTSGTISPGRIHIWYSSLNNWKERIGELKKTLSENEIFRSEQFAFMERREDFIISRGIMRKILGRYLEMAPEQIEFKIDPTGKPYLPGSRYQFNSSHSNDIFLIGITMENPIGVDVQHIYPISNIDLLIKRFFNTHEQEIMNSFQEEDILDMFFTIWTAKEAYLKGTGEGLRRSISSFSICRKENGLLSFSPQKGRESAPITWNIHHLHLDPAYKAALAVKGNILQLLTQSLQPKRVD